MIRLGSILSVLAVLIGCSDKSPVAEHEANRYQTAVYFNPQRPQEDRRDDAQRKPADILAFAGVEPGMKVIDLLGGSGWYTELLAAVVGEEGQVYLVNTPLFLHFTQTEMEARLADNRLQNVTRVDGEWTQMNLPEDADLIWLSLAYHDIYVTRPNDPSFEADRDSFFQQIKAALKPGGHILVIDHAATPGTGKEAAQTLHRIDENFARADFESEGFVFVKSLDILRNPADDYEQSIWAKGIMNKTDKFIYLFQKPME